MPRLNVVDPARATGRAKEIFDGPLKGKHFNIFKGMANSGAALDAYLAMSHALGQGLLSLKEREAIQLAMAQARNCDYCAAAHTAIGKGAGFSDADTLAARRGSMTDPRLNAIVRFALALDSKRGMVSDADLGALRAAGLDDGHTVEIIANVALATYTNFFNQANQTEVDFPAAPAL